VKRPKPPSVRTVALNDQYLFIGTDNRIHVFATDARKSGGGKLVFSRDIGADMQLDKLVVSPDGNTLFVLARKSFAFQIALVYSATLEPPQLSQSFVPTATIAWDNCTRLHNSATFSADRNKVAIFMSLQEGKSEIRFLRRIGQQWLECRNPLMVTVSDDPEARLGHKGITGAALLTTPFS